MSAVFTNDYNVSVNVNKTIKTIEHPFTELFIKQHVCDVLFRRIVTYLIQEKFINGNIIDAGAWIGNNSIEWATNQNNIVYAIDPCFANIDYITKLAKENDINNIQTQHNVLSDRNETLSTNDDKNNCHFMKNTTGKIKMTAVTIDHLYSKNHFDNISFIHLTVDGFEYNVIQGATNIIENFKPIIAFQQHLNKDNYKELCSVLYAKGYNVYLINEVIYDDRTDCRNFIAIPNNYQINLYDLHHRIGNNNVLLSIMKWNNVTNVTNTTAYTATIFGDSIKNNNIGNIKSIYFNGYHIFSINDNNYTKMIVIDENENWICAKHILGEVDINCEETVINTYLSARTNVKQQNYNIKHIKKS
jgi:FkbM family methyltransferase